MNRGCSFCKHSRIHPEFLKSGKIWCVVKGKATEYIWNCDKYESKHTFEHIDPNPITHTWYVCPKCGGGFSQWDSVLGVAVTVRCPFCGMRKGEYERKKENNK